MPALIEALKDQKRGVRFAATFALTEIHDSRSIPALEASLSDRNDLPRIGAGCALAFLGQQSAIPNLKKELRDRSGWRCFAATVALIGLGTPEAKELLKEKIDNSIPTISQLARRGVAGEGAMALTHTLLHDKDEDYRHYAARCLMFFNDPRTIPALEKAAVEDRDITVRLNARYIARRIKRLSQESSQ